MIEDLLGSFFANPQLILLQPEFGKKNPNLSAYVTEMRQAVANVDRRNIGNLLRMEDGHLVSFSLLFDVTVYVYDLPRAKWYVYGSGG